MTRPTSTIASSKHNQPTSTPPLYSNTPRYTAKFSSRILNLKSSQLPKLSSSYILAKSPVSYQTPLSSSVNTYPQVSSVNTEDPQVVPSSLIFFHAFGTLEFNHISGLNYYANGTLKIRAPVTTQLINSTSDIKQSIIPTSSLNNQIVSTTSPSSNFKKIPTTIQSLSVKPSSTILKTSTISNTHTSSSLAPTAVTSSMPNIVTTSAIMTTGK